MLDLPEYVISHYNCSPSQYLGFPVSYCTYCFQDITKARKIPKRALPIICFREGSPPLPDASNTSIIDSGYLTQLQLKTSFISSLGCTFSNTFLGCYSFLKTMFWTRKKGANHSKLHQPFEAMILFEVVFRSSLLQQDQLL